MLRRVNVLATLIEHPDLLKNDIGGWIALQAPFEGTLLADIVTSTSISRLIVTMTLKLLGGSKDGLHSLTTDFRKAIMETSLNGIEDIVKKISVLTFGGAFNSYDRGVLTVTMRFQSDPNDGVVPLDGTLLKKNEAPLCSYIKAKPIDHLETVIQKNNIVSFFKSKFDRQRFLDVLLKLWLDNGLH